MFACRERSDNGDQEITEGALFSHCLWDRYPIYNASIHHV